MAEVLGAIAAVLAVVGVLLNNRMNRICFAIWMVSNAICAILHASAGMWSLYWRDVIFYVLAIEGFYRWKFKRGLNAE